jgi:hypothetical protein
MGLSTSMYHETHFLYNMSQNIIMEIFFQNFIELFNTPKNEDKLNLCDF